MMKQWSVIIIWLTAGLLIVGLIACSQNDDPVTESKPSSPTEAIAITTPAPSAIPTNEPSATPTASLTPAATLTSTPSAIPFLNLTPTATPSPTPAWPDVPLPEGSQSYQLRPPSIENIVQAARAFNAQMPSVRYGPDLTAQQRSLVHNQLDALSLLIGNDIEQYYTTGFSVDPAFLNEALADKSLNVFGKFDSGLALLTQQALADYFAAPLPDRQAQAREWELTLAAVDLDGDTATEWIAEISIPGLNLFQYLPLEGNEADGYQIIPNRLPIYPHWLGERPERIIVDTDLTGDGVPELIIEELSEGPAHYSYGLKIFTWNGTELSQIGIDKRYGSALIFDYYPQMEIVDVTGDGVSDIQVTWSHHDNFNCTWDRIDIFSWQGQQSQHQLSPGAPDTPFCNINEVSYTSPLANRIPLLERVLAQLTVSDIESADLAAFVRAHLAFAYASQHQDQQAANILNGLDTLSGEAAYAQLLQAEYESSNGSIMALCRQLHTKGDAILDTTMGQYLNQWATNRIEDSSNIPSLYDICPLQKLAQERLKTIGNLSAQQPPLDLLAASDIELAFAQPVNIDQDAADEWLGILEPMSAPELLIFDAVNGVWQIHVVDLPLFNPVFDLKFDVRNLVGDTTPEIIAIIQTANSYEPFAIAAVNNTYQQIGSCCFALSEAPVLSELDRDFFRLNPQGPEWVALVGFDSEADDLWDAISQLTESAVAGERPSSLPEEITALINYLPLDNADAQLVVEYLTYLLGYTHELNGREAQAVTIYLELIEEVPQSPWSWLAWAHLEAGPNE